MDVLDVRAQHLVALGVRHYATLHEVGRVPRGPQVGRIHRLEDVQTAAWNVAVNMLLVLVQQRHLQRSCRLRETPHAIQHFLPVRLRLLSLGNEEREDANVGRTHELRDVQCAREASEVRLEWVGDRYLADGRADRGNANPRLVQPTLDLGQLSIREVEHVLAPHPTELQVAHVLGLERS